MPGLIARMRQAWYGDQSAPETPTSPKKNPWREVFDPNSNPNMKRTSREYYDTPDKDQKSVWDYHVEAEKASGGAKQAAFSPVTGANKDFIEASDLRKLFEQDRVDRIMQAADKNKDGHIDYKEFCSMLRQN